MMMAMTLSSLQLLAKPWSNNNSNNYYNHVNNKDFMIASASRNNDGHNVIFFAPLTVAVTAADEGVTHPCRCLLTSTPSCRRRGGDPLLSKPQSTKNDKDNDASIASASKNNKDHMRSLLGWQTMVELLA
jgi:hypothetical protein